jgi:RyR domain-containing protein
MTTMTETPGRHAGGMHRYSDADVAGVCQAAAVALTQIQSRAGEAAATGPFAALDPDLADAAVEAVRRARSGTTPREHHEQWARGLREQGWQHGPRDPAAKTHPGLLPYSELPAAQRDRDRMFLAIVTALTDVFP